MYIYMYMFAYMYLHNLNTINEQTSSLQSKYLVYKVYAIPLKYTHTRMSLICVYMIFSRVARVYMYSLAWSCVCRWFGLLFIKPVALPRLLKLPVYFFLYKEVLYTVHSYRLELLLTDQCSRCSLATYMYISP